MTVPDRIWISLSAPEYTTLDPNDPEWTLMGYYDEFYIRRGAFPVEEIRAALDDGSLQGMAAIRVQLRRILSLLESDE